MSRCHREAASDRFRDCSKGPACSRETTATPPRELRLRTSPVHRHQRLAIQTAESSALASTANPIRPVHLPTLEIRRTRTTSCHFPQTYCRPIQVVTTLPVAHGQPRFSAMAAEDIRCASPRQRAWSSLLPPHRRRPGPDDGGGGMPAPTSCGGACKLDKGSSCT